MQENDTAVTKVFYHLMDLSDSEQEVYLKKIESLQPELYKQVSPLILKSIESFTQLFGFYAHNATYKELDLKSKLIDKYLISNELGRGGIGIVYAASRADKTFEQDLAIKIIQPGINPILGKEVLFEEAQLLANLNHPNIVKVFDGGVFQDLAYFVMEFIEGMTLSQYLVSTQLTDKRRLQVFKSVCSAIEHAHNNNILHADIKPENILIDKWHEPKIIDFNITKKLKGAQGNPSRYISAFSRDYASPEQKKGKFLCPKSDIYSLGKVLHLMFPSLTKQAGVACIIEKATQYDKNLRYNSVVEMYHDINNLMSGRPIIQ